jgi:DNA-binding LytR/AlgR family response regulator
MMTCIIVDDEPLARKGIENYVAQTNNLLLLDSFEHAQEAINFIKKNKVDLLLLDISMPDISGIDMLQNLTDAPLTIFITADATFGSEAYDLDVIDYLVKPVLFERFQKAIDKATDFFQFKRNPHEIDHLFFKVNHIQRKIMFHDILYIKALSNYIAIHTQHEKLIVYQSIRSVEMQLPSNSFSRIHKSYLINFSHLISFSKKFVLIDKVNIPIGRMYLQEFETCMSMKK